MIGSLPKTSPSITDVGADASREHLRIWLEGEHWYAQGLGSTNGTVLESGAGDGDIVIEPPRDQREPGKVYPRWKSKTATGSIWVSTRHSLSLWTSADGDRKTVAVRLSSSTFCVVNDNTQRYTWAVRLSWYFTDIRTAHVYVRQPMPDKGTPWILPIAPMATNSSVSTFDTAVAVDPSAEDDAKRRFMTLILQTAYHDGGNIGHVLRATNTNGEVFAVKLLKDNAILSGQALDRSAEQSAAHLANTAALFEEYRHLCTVSHLRRFPACLWLRFLRG